MKPIKWVVVINCPVCNHGDVLFTSNSLKKRCGNKWDCGAIVTHKMAKARIDEVLKSLEETK